MIKREEKCCEWCGRFTSMGKIKASAIPIMEYIEDKINLRGRDKIWGDDSQWQDEDMSSEFEAELLVYDDMLNDIKMRRICGPCLMEDDRLWRHYYGEETEIVIEEIDGLFRKNDGENDDEDSNDELDFNAEF
jgi:hypothetical protein